MEKSKVENKYCEISDCEDNWTDSIDELEDQHSSSEELGKSVNAIYFDPTKITTSLPLLPFNNQVGGHASFFRFSKKAICKPVSAKEQEFYEHIDAEHHELLPFTCQYMGVLNVTYRSGEEDGPVVPEVVFEKNKHLLRDWRACTIERRHSTTTHDRSKKFQQVLTEVFSPQALRERIMMAESWKRKHRLSSVGSTSSLKELESRKKRENQETKGVENDLPHSYSDQFTESKHWGDSMLVDGSGSVPNMRSILFTPSGEGLISEDDEEDDDSSILTDSIEHITIQSKRTIHPTDTSNVTEDDDTIFEMEEFNENNNYQNFKKKKNSNGPILQIDSNYLHNKPKDSPTTPWSLQIYQRDLQKMNNNPMEQQKYILIEDLTNEVKYPCVLDLKMGTRQYGVFATREKMRSQTIKCEKSTSKLLGVRICGMQVYKRNTNEFLFQDKYYGRELTPLDCRNTLEAYLDNGDGCQIQHIPVIIRKLRRLARIIKSMNDYRLYASSLLLIYDGDPNSKRKIDVRIIDFANCVTSEDTRFNHQFTYPPRHQGPDNGYLLGLKSLVMCFEWIYKVKYNQHLDDITDDIFHDIHDSSNTEVLSLILQS